MDQVIFHGYCFGTAAWYALRGGCRVFDPVMVIGWFRPPSQLNLSPNDLETYTIGTDGWGLITLALILVLLSAYETSTTSSFKRAAVLATVFHHVTTAHGSWQHYKLDSHYNTAMSIGVWANVWLTLAGLAALVMMPGSQEAGKVRETARKNI